MKDLIFNILFPVDVITESLSLLMGENRTAKIVYVDETMSGKLVNNNYYSSNNFKNNDLHKNNFITTIFHTMFPLTQDINIKLLQWK